MKPQRVGRCVKSAKIDLLIADDAADLADLLMRQLEEFVEQAELVHHFERRGMDGVAAKVAQEIGMLLQHQDIDAGAGEQKAQHHARGSAPAMAHCVVIFSAAISYVPSTASFRRKPVSSAHTRCSVTWIPAFAGMTSKYRVSSLNRQPPPSLQGGATGHGTEGSGHSAGSPDPSRN